MRKVCILTFVLCLIISIAANTYAQLPDFQIDVKSITFSNPTPVEGEEILIWVDVKNIGSVAPTMNEDLVVDLYEGDPSTKPLQILSLGVILELKPNETERITAKWQPHLARPISMPMLTPQVRNISQNPTIRIIEHMQQSQRHKNVPRCNCETDPNRYRSRCSMDRIASRQNKSQLFAMWHRKSDCPVVFYLSSKFKGTGREFCSRF